MTEKSHQHIWVKCDHNGIDSLGSSMICRKISQYLNYGHYICDFCGEEKYRSRKEKVAMLENGVELA